ncbi:hypothetical protein EK904_008077 [Melospiza melodia maxima]|nr:hypothetical protein EK904_008077 [Melospiza melodia maxima]
MASPATDMLPVSHLRKFLTLNIRAVQHKDLLYAREGGAFTEINHKFSGVALWAKLSWGSFDLCPAEPLSVPAGPLNPLHPWGGKSSCGSCLGTPWFEGAGLDGHWGELQSPGGSLLYLKAGTKTLSRFALFVLHLAEISISDTSAPLSCTAHQDEPSLPLLAPSWHLRCTQVH